MVTQSVQLFRATIRDNLTFFDPQVAGAHILDGGHIAEYGRRQDLAARADAHFSQLLKPG
ncbi:MAG: ABC-type multidrug transport system fused ATPase/permease subunit [Candidatus Latescibacterota bacterium]|jgi:ABC-type multidrug transport system fused ATPase/permease subunit